MPKSTYQDAIKNLDFANVVLTELPNEVGSRINDLIATFPDKEDQIIELLPYTIRLVYVIGELESVIGNDGLLSIFINYDKNQVDRFETAVEQSSHKKYLSLFKKARSLAESKYQLKDGINLADDLPEADIEEVFGYKIIDKIETIEEQMNELQDKGEYWNKIEALYEKSLNK
ncbi:MULTISPECIES: hypothetical protein [unclassified Spirosoma]|uniref:DMP19 family protein n=1 Tax=unclassified Spirosoma TaxID=2621999 RepID=UPI00096587B9|nr:MULTISPECIES: hypothetical protein [unclassified Spirosoma]MBN8826288.1 hypothetical protein [Spirosoma sp.]OJW75188.1 MAG: hypothetical protein BGO59_18005 [Spirosoma sp. 48-14]